MNPSLPAAPVEAVVPSDEQASTDEACRFIVWWHQNRSRFTTTRQAALKAWNDRAAISPPAVLVEAAGWKLVPIEPTEAMEQFICDCDIRSGAKYSKEGENIFPDWKTCYRAMLAAAPAVPLGGARDHVHPIEPSLGFPDAAGEGSRWIDVSERLPEPETDVLCRRQFGASLLPPIVAGLFKGEWYSFDQDEKPIQHVTHWTPLLKDWSWQ
jgi:hypothetical protein